MSKEKEYKEELQRRLGKLEDCMSKSECGGCSYRDICKDEEKSLRKELKKIR